MRYTKLLLVFILFVMHTYYVCGQSTIKRDTKKDVRTATVAVRSSVSRKHIAKTVNNKPLNGYLNKTYDDGSSFSGYFENGLPNGQGTLVFPRGVLRYVGNFENGNLEGQGTLYLEDGSKLYEGNFHNDEAYGKGTYYKWGKAIESSNWYNHFCADNIVFYMGDGYVYTGSIVDGDLGRGAVLTSESFLYVYLDSNGNLQEDKNVPYGKHFDVFNNSNINRTSFHIWGLATVDFSILGTVLTKYVDPMSANTWICSERNEFIEDADTGRKYYIENSAIGFDQGAVVLNNTNRAMFTEIYPILPSNVKRINIGDGSFYYVKNLRVRY